MNIEQLYIDWIYENIPIGNGDMLVEAMEDMSNFANFLSDVGLPPDTELN